MGCEMPADLSTAKCQTKRPSVNEHKRHLSAVLSDALVLTLLKEGPTAFVCINQARLIKCALAHQHIGSDEELHKRQCQAILGNIHYMSKEQSDWRKIQAPIGNKAEWQSNLWQRDRMNSWMLQLPEHKSVSQVYLLCCPSHVVSNLGVSRKSGNKTVAADYQEQPKVLVHVWGFTLLLKASHFAGSIAGSSPRTGARRISLTTQEVGWVRSAGPKCLRELAPSFTANGSPTRLTTPLLQGRLCISSFGKAREKTSSSALELTPFKKLEAIPGNSVSYKSTKFPHEQVFLWMAVGTGPQPRNSPTTKRFPRDFRASRNLQLALRSPQQPANPKRTRTGAAPSPPRVAPRLRQPPVGRQPQKERGSEEEGDGKENWVSRILQALGEIQDRGTHRLLMGLCDRDYEVELELKVAVQHPIPGQLSPLLSLHTLLFCQVPVAVLKQQREPSRSAMNEYWPACAGLTEDGGSRRGSGDQKPPGMRNGQRISADEQRTYPGLYSKIQIQRIVNTGGGYGEAVALLLLRNYRRISYECSTTVNHGPVNGNGLEVVRARSRLVLSISKSPGRASLRRRLEKPCWVNSTRNEAAQQNTVKDPLAEYSPDDCYPDTGAQGYNAKLDSHLGYCGRTLKGICLKGRTMRWTLVQLTIRSQSCVFAKSNSMQLKGWLWRRCSEATPLFLVTHVGLKLKLEEMKVRAMQVLSASSDSEEKWIRLRVCFDSFSGELCSANPLLKEGLLLIMEREKGSKSFSEINPFLHVIEVAPRSSEGKKELDGTTFCFPSMDLTAKTSDLQSCHFPPRLPFTEAGSLGLPVFLQAQAQAPATVFLQAQAPAMLLLFFCIRSECPEGYFQRTPVSVAMASDETRDSRWETCQRSANSPCLDCSGRQVTASNTKTMLTIHYAVVCGIEQELLHALEHEDSSNAGSLIQEAWRPWPLLCTDDQQRGKYNSRQLDVASNYDNCLRPSSFFRYYSALVAGIQKYAVPESCRQLLAAPVLWALQGEQCRAHHQDGCRSVVQQHHPPTPAPPQTSSRLVAGHGFAVPGKMKQQRPDLLRAASRPEYESHVERKGQTSFDAGSF
ncbi:hypothetical protein Anapl_17078 [Anas platyrhynchos]|uniref:Uncharacterized protein n=1 Tax=Anas platyrhynchos TaxID=8839 RepID=R0JM39_ANAPL|nr:hypothetical protein Anapl_17078 [Anas platyrhynchos]